MTGEPIERAYFERGFIAAVAWAMTKREDVKLSDDVIDHAWAHRDEGMDAEDMLPPLRPSAPGTPLTSEREGDWVLVPRELPEAMAKAGAKGRQNSAISSFRDGWKLALAVAPSPATPDPVEAQALPQREAIALQVALRVAAWTSHVTSVTRAYAHGSDVLVTVDDCKREADAILALAQPGSSDEVERLRRGLMNAMLCLSGFAGQGITVEGFDDPADVYGASADLIGMPDADDDDLRTALSTPSHANGGEG